MTKRETYLVWLVALVAILLTCSTNADTPPARSINSQTYNGAGTVPITATASGAKNGLDVYLINPSSGSSSVTGSVSITNFPSYFPVSQSGAWTTGRTWLLSSATDSITAAISNFPATQAVTQSGTWNVGLNAGSNTIGKVDQGTGGASAWKVDGSAVTQPISGTVTANQGGTWNTGRTWSLSLASDSVNAAQSGTWTTGRTWSLLNTTDSVNVGNFPAQYPSTQSGAWTVGRSWSLSSASDTLNVANFSAFYPASQSGAWTTGRTWSLLNSTDSVNSVQSGVWSTGRTWNLASSADVVGASQAGAWSVGRTWNLASAADSVQASQNGSWDVRNITGTVSLPTGAATETSLAKLTLSQGASITSQSGALTFGAVSGNMPAYASGTVQPHSMNLRGAMRVKNTGFDSTILIRNDYSSVSVSSAAYTQLTASTSNDINRLMIFDSSGQDFVLATGAAASEVDQIQIPPGGWDSPIEIFIASGTRLSIKSKASTASSGILLITGLK